MRSGADAGCLSSDVMPGVHDTTDQHATIPLGPLEERVLRAFWRAAVAVPRAHDVQLWAEARLSMSEYAALVHLSEAPDRTLPMGDLAVLMTMSPSGTTRLVGNLEQRGLAQRSTSPEDGRLKLASLTGEGYDALEAAAPAPADDLRRR